MRMMRHESIQTTMAFYVDLDADEQSPKTFIGLRASKCRFWCRPPLYA